MKAGVFVTGTDTGVGKTLVACALVLAARRRGLACAGMKPVAAGALEGPDGWVNEDAEALAAVSEPGLPRALTNPVCLPEALAPHVAAARAGMQIRFAPIEAAFGALAARLDALVVEGAGGFRVPLGPDGDSADLARRLGLPLVLVVGLRLGCINHALLSAEAIESRGLRLAGWVGNRIDPAMDAWEDSVAALAARLPGPLLGVLPWDPRPSAAAAATALDCAPVWGA